MIGEGLLEGSTSSLLRLLLLLLLGFALSSQVPRLLGISPSRVFKNLLVYFVSIDF